MSHRIVCSRVMGCLALIALCSPACSKSDDGADGGGFDAETSPFGLRTKTTRVNFQTTRDSEILSSTLTMGVSKTVNGQAYDQYVTTGTKGHTTAVVATQGSDGKISFAGLDHAGAQHPSLGVVLSAPVVVDTRATVGESRSIQLTASVNDSGTTSEVTATGSYTLVESDVAVQTPGGTIAGCSHFAGSVSGEGAAVPEAYRGTAVSGEIWYHPSFGIVKFDAPEVGWSAGMTDANDYGEVDSSGHRLLKKTAVMDSARPFRLSTYDVHQTFDADMQEHAKMLVELRWADDAMAKQSAPGVQYNPMLHCEFGTTMGYFPSALLESSQSVFFPEEKAQGYKYAIGFVSQANKSSQSADSYRIEVSADSGLSAIRVTGRIYYKAAQGADPSAGGPAPTLDAGGS